MELTISLPVLIGQTKSSSKFWPFCTVPFSIYSHPVIEPVDFVSERSESVDKIGPVRRTRPWSPQVILTNRGISLAYKNTVCLFVCNVCLVRSWLYAPVFSFSGSRKHWCTPVTHGLTERKKYQRPWLIRAPDQSVRNRLGQAIASPQYVRVNLAKWKQWLEDKLTPALRSNLAACKRFNHIVMTLGYLWVSVT